MARIRSAKPEFWTDPKMCALPRDVRFTFKGLWEVCADDDGRFLSDPRIIKGQVWPLDDDITPKKVERWLAILAERGRIALYEVDGARYGAIVNWHRHQKISHPTPSKLPPPQGEFPEPRRNSSGDVPEEFRPEAEAERDVDVDGDGIRSGAEAPAIPDDPDPLSREQPAAPPAPRVELPREAERFVDELYGLATAKRRTDVRRQLCDALDPEGRGARLRKGVQVKARSPEHLAAVCEAVRLDPPRQLDAAIVIVLQKLLDPPPGPTPTEVAARETGQREALEELYFREARAAGLAWSHEHPAEYAELRRPIDAEYGDMPSAWRKTARDAVLVQATARAAGFPSFDEWNAARTNKPPLRIA